MKTDLFDYELPQSLIAQYPPAERGATRLLQMDRRTGKTAHRKYCDIPDLIREDDVVVLNDTKVIQARTFPTVERTGKNVELFFLNKIPSPDSDEDAAKERWYCLVGRARNVKVGDVLVFEEPGEQEKGFEVYIIDREKGAKGFIVEVESSKELMETFGHVPLPPYMKREDMPLDKQRYSTVFAQKDGSVAAPTASLNLTDEMLAQIRVKGVKTCFVNLVVGLGTFSPVDTDEIEDFRIHSELTMIPQETVEVVNSCSGRVWAFGTTVVRALESAAVASGKISKFYQETDLFIYPGYDFKIVDVLVTNFHMPKSSLIMLVSAFSTREHVLGAYEEAKRSGYKFLSYGDSMLIGDFG